MADPRIILWFYFVLLRRRKKINRRYRQRRNVLLTKKIGFLLQMLQKKWKSTVNSCLVVTMLYGCLTFRDVWNWFKPNHSYWTIASQQWTPKMWVRHLRMKKESFLYLCRDLRPHLEKQQTRFREPIPVSKRIAIALWRLATGIDYRSIAQLFGVGRSTCCKITHHVSHALVAVLLTRFITIVANERINETKEAFRAMSGLPQCVGAVDGCHIPILAPKENHCDYFNRKSFHSIVLQGTVDHRRR